MIDIAQFKEQLKKSDALRGDDEIQIGTVECIQPQYAQEWSSELHPSVRDALIRAGITTPYEHQAEAISRSLNGTDIVLESPTASGKTLAFAAPMLDALVRNPGSHALMIYPMKALAFDQREQIEKLCEPLRIESFPYDGDTDKEHRDLLRNHPIPILLTNPEYLNRSFLAYKEQWEGFLRNLRYIIIDEMHEYRGFFGANMALLLRRFFLHLNRIGANPRVFLSTATCANPVEHAKNLTGRDAESNGGDEQSEEESEDGDGTRSKPTNLRVTRPDGNVIYHHDGKKTYIEVLEKLGLEEVMRVRPKTVSKEPFPYGNKGIKRGRFWVRGTKGEYGGTKGRKAELEKIASLLNVSLLVERVEKTPKSG